MKNDSEKRGLNQSRKNFIFVKFCIAIAQEAGKKSEKREMKFDKFFWLVKIKANLKPLPNPIKLSMVSSRLNLNPQS